MKPNFALSLSFEGLRLMHRTGGGWALVGEVALDDADLNGALARLRAAALRLEPNGMATKLLLPDAQIRYLALDGTGTEEEDVRAALDGATPYALADLVYDYSKGGGRTYVAAVARETLKEAEAFASEHGFNPVSFVAVPDPFAFVGEPYFGPASSVGDQDVTRDDEPVVVIGRAAVDPKAIETETRPPRASSGSAPETEEPAEVAQGPVDEIESSPAETSEDAPVPDPAPAPAEEETDSPSPRAEAGGPDPAEAEEAPLFFGTRRAAAATESDPGTAVPPTPPAPPAGPERGTVAGDDSGEEPRFFFGTRRGAAPLVASRETEDAAAPPLSFNPGEDTAPVNVPDDGLAAMPSEEPATGPALKADRPGTVPRETAPALAASLTATPDPTPAAEPDAPAGGGDRAQGLFRSRRKAREPQAGAFAPEAPMDESERLTVFGARKSSPKVGGKPRFLGLILTALLILLLLAVAALAALNDETISRWLGLDEAPVQTAAAPPARPAMETGEPRAPVSGSAVPETPQPEGPAPVPSLPERPDPGAPASDQPEVQTGTPAAPDDAAPEDESPAQPQPERFEAAQASDPAPRATPPGTVLSPAEAQRIYAATGVWQRAPRIPDSPRGQAFEEIPVSDGFATPDRRPPNGLPRGTAQDAVIARPPNPPAPDTEFEFGPDGFVVATSEGALTPDGILVYAGAPALSPPPRPGTEPPERTVLEQLAAVIPDEAPARADPEAGVMVIAAQPLLTPPVRPGTPPPAAEQETEAAEGPAEDGLNVIPTAPPLIPPARPDRVTAAADTPGPSGLIAEDAPTLRPRPRPDGLAPPAQEDDGTADEDEASLTLDTEIAAAVQQAAARPDPFADATEQAPLASLRPGTRPGNFDRIVASARPAPAVAQPARPSGPTTASVARAATDEGAINLRRVNLIGVYGSSSDRRALVRLSNGRYTRVTVGDRLDGGRVRAIGAGSLVYDKRGRRISLEVGG